MNLRTSACSLCLFGAAGLAPAVALADVAPHAGMLRFPDVSGSHIVFSYANDLWLVPREGGVATPLASPPGVELFPRFSPDGKSIAFMGNYDGDTDLYTLAVDGGVPVRVTHHPGTEGMCDWTPDGRLIFATNSFAGRNRQTQLFTVGAEGGLPQQIPVPYGANGTVSEDGVWLAYTPHSRDFRTWKRYRGGMATDVWLFNLKNNTSRRVTDWEGTDTIPMWRGTTVFYLSDAGPEHRLNIWSFDTTSGRGAQVTKFKDHDVKFPSMGPGQRGQGEIVFQNGADLYLLDLGGNMMSTVNVTIPGARPTLRPKPVDAKDYFSAAGISPSGKRAVVSARGDVWTAPAEHGSPRNLTRSSGAFERSPAWSPDSRWIAYFSDESGEYELYITQSDGRGETKQLTEGSGTFYFEPIWSPDSKKVAFTDKAGNVYLHVIEGGETKTIDTSPWAWDNGDNTLSWSHDSRWLAWARPLKEAPEPCVWLYDSKNDEKHQVTAGMFADSYPTFDRKGDYLFFTSGRSFRPEYGEYDTSFIYADTGVLVAVPLRKDVESPYLAKSDEEKWKDEEADKDNGDGKEDADDDNGEDANGEKKKEEKPADDGVSGTWTGEISGGPPLPPGPLPITINLHVAADGSVSGSVTVPIGTATISSGTFDKATGALNCTVVDPDGVEYTLTGTIRGKSFEGSVVSAAVGFNADFTADRTAAATDDDDDEEDSKKDDKPAKEVIIEVSGFEGRAMLLPVKRGVFTNLAVNDKGQLLYMRRPSRGEDGNASIMLFDLKDEKKEEKTVAAGADGFDISADGKKLLVFRDRAASIQDASAGASGKPVVNAGMTVWVDPRAEWNQIFTDAWRIFRDYFYDPGMHGVDWEGVRDHYAVMLDDCASREDVAYVIGEMISELNVGHAYYRGGGDVDRAPTIAVGLLGCDYELATTDDGTAYRISRIHKGADWDLDARGPLSQPGVDVKEGDFLLAVNGVPVNTSKDPWAAFPNMVGRAVTLTVSEKPILDDTARQVIVEPIGNETELRYRSWIERNRAFVDEQTSGRVGYVYVPSTGLDGQNDLVRQFYGQRHKPAMIIDERWNSGGQIPTRFIELLNRPVTNYWARRESNDWTWPPDAHNGPKCMLINGLSGSGGDAFPAYFKQAGLGKLIGTRTWGGLVGLSGNPQLIDGAGIAVPTFGYYESDGTWGIEGHGVDPDIEVLDDPAKMVGGRDPQLDAAINHILAELQQNPYVPPQRPAYPNRTGMGLPQADR